MNYNNLLLKVSKEYECKECNYKSCNKNNFAKHLNTRKHKNTIIYNENLLNVLANQFTCECGKRYPYRASLYNHKKRCQFGKCEESKKDYIESIESIKTDESSELKKSKSLNSNDDDIDYKSMIMKLIDENSEFKNLLIKQQNQIGDLIPKVGNNNTNIKQKFNINIFLNEQCRDAININDFIKQIEVSLDNLLTTRDKGLSEGLSNVFIENMNKLSLYERPLHCTDIKRETLYIKDNNVWEKDIDKSKIKTAIKEVSCAQFKSVKKWIDENPKYEEDESKQEEFINLIRNCSQNIDSVDDKIIKRLCNSSYLKDKLEE
tara:strand:- start:159 stop:1115 length:957 start_codon:yes stop_codon:yes gene_type:complete